MNPRMWSHAATRANAELLVARGVELIGPDEGELAEGEWGVGRLAEPDEIAARVEQLLAPGSLDRPPRARHRRRNARADRQRPLPRQPLVGPHGRRPGRGGAPARRRRRAAGRESAGAGAATASRCCRRRRPRRCSTPRSRSPTSTSPCLRPPSPTTGRWRRSTASVRRTTTPGRSSSRRRSTSRERSASGRRAGQILVAFGADHGDEGLERKRGMLASKHADLVVFNDVGRPGIGFDSADNEVVLVTAAGERTVDRAAKRQIAAAILDAVEELLGAPYRGHDGSEMSEAYEHFKEGQARLRKGMPAQATVALEKAKRLEPGKASIREALGIAYFRLHRWQEAEREFRTIVEELSADRRLRPLRTRQVTREAGPARRGERPLQAGKLDEPRLRAVRGPHPAARGRRRSRGGMRAVVQRVSRASVDAGRGDRRGALRPARHRRGRRRAPPAAGWRRKVARSASSRTTRASSTGRCSTSAVRRSSSASSRCWPTRGRGTGRASPPRRDPRTPSHSTSGSAPSCVRSGSWSRPACSARRWSSSS